MDHSSEEESDISESEIEDYKDKPLEDLRSGNLRVKVNGFLRCPFCAGKKKQDYKYKDLLQHATGVSKGSASRSAKQKANHLALARYLEIELANEAEQTPRQVVPQPIKPPPEQQELFVWPWMGIVVNLTEQRDNEYWMKKFAEYKPLEFCTFFNEEDHSTQAIVRFNRDWDGFMNATRFEQLFDNANHGKKDWKTRKTQPGSSIYGWRARADDHNSDGPIGEYLRREGRLNTIPAIVQEYNESKNTVVAHLADKIDEANKNLDKLHYNFNEKNMSLRRMLEEKDKLHYAFVEGMFLSFCEHLIGIGTVHLHNLHKCQLMGAYVSSTSPCLCTDSYLHCTLFVPNCFVNIRLSSLAVVRHAILLYLSIRVEYPQ